MEGGGDVITLRQHQKDALTMASRYISGEWSFKTRPVATTYITPGAGKTGMSHVYASALIAAGLINRVVIVAPRKSLVTQTIDAWQTSRFGEPRRLVNVTGASLAEGLHLSEFGAVTTYQAVAKNSASADCVSYIAGADTLLILDEPHHMRMGGVGAESAWFDAVAPMASRARHTLLMSGTMYRHDGQRIPLAAYDANGSIAPDITYTRRQALGEHAVLPIEITRIPADVVYGKGDREFSVSLSDASPTEQAPALRTALEMASYRDEKILDFLREHALYRKGCPGSAAIVVVHTQKTARHVAALARRVLGLDIALAISDDDGAHGAIAAFRKGYGPHVLVTVGMAYEGLDAPHATHLALFTAIRSSPWLTQASARVTRFNPDFGPWESQRAHITAPDDPAMRAHWEGMLAEEKPERVPEVGPLGPPVERAEDRKEAERVTAIDAAPLPARYSDDEGEVPDAPGIRWLRTISPLYGKMPPRRAASVVQVLQRMGFKPGVTGLRVHIGRSAASSALVPTHLSDKANRFSTVARQAIAFADMVLDCRATRGAISDDEIATRAAEFRERMLAIGIPKRDLGTITGPEVAA